MSDSASNDIDDVMNQFLMKEVSNNIKMEPSRMDYEDINRILEDAWPSSPDDLLDNIFSLEDGPLLEHGPVDPVHVDQGNLTPSDSGLSMDHSDFDMLSLSPMLNDYDNGDGGHLLHSLPLTSPLPSPISSLSPSPPPTITVSHPQQPLQPAQHPVIHITEKQPNTIKDTTNNNSLKRKSPTSPATLSLPKIQKHYVNRRDSTSSSTSSTSSNGAPRVIICNSPPAIKQQPPRKVIRVTPVQGSISNPRSILLPVTLKDMKEFKTIKIINASDLKNSASIKIAAANFLQQSKQVVRETPKTNKILYTTATYDADEQRYVMEECGSSGRSEEEGDHEDEESLEEDSNGDGKQFPRLMLTPEERRLLQREGVSLPDRYPLTRGEERELKRIRRKIRNKISAQDSRRRKKEYVDGLEDRVKQCTDENQSLMKRIKVLQSQNNSLTAQLKKLQNMMSGSNGSTTKTAPPATCLMVLLLSMALVVAPNLRPSPPQHSPPAQHSPAQHNTHLTSATHSHFVSSIRRALLSMQAIHPVTPLEEVIEEESPIDEMVLGDHTYNMPGSPNSAKDLVGTGAPLYMDMPLDGDNLLKVEKIDYDSDYGGSTTAEHITLTNDWGGKTNVDLNMALHNNNNNSFTGPRTIVVNAAGDVNVPAIR